MTVLMTRSDSRHDSRNGERDRRRRSQDRGTEFYDDDDHDLVAVIVEDGSEHLFLKAPKWSIFVLVQQRNLIGLRYGTARRLTMFWGDAADKGIHRIIDAFIEPIAPDDPIRCDTGGDRRVLVLLSNGDLECAFAYDGGDLTFAESEFLDLTIGDARALKSQRSQE